MNISQSGNEIYAPLNVNVPVFIDRAQQEIQVSYLPANDELTYNNSGQTVTLVATHSSPTAPPSSVPVTFASTSPTICTTTGTNGATLTVVGAGMCSVTLNEACDDFAHACQGGNYYAAPQLAPPPFNIKKADQNLTFGTAPSDVTFGNAAQTVSATVTSPTAPPSTSPPNNLLVAYTSQTAPICTASGTSVMINGAGTCTIAAAQPGNANYNAATPTPMPPPGQTGLAQSFVIAKAQQAITFVGSAPSGVTFGDTAVITVSATSATVTPPSGTAAGPSGIAVVLSSLTEPVCTIAGNTVTIVSAGYCTIAANQAGNDNYEVAPQVTRSFDIARGKINVTATVTPTSFTYGDDVAPNAITVTTGTTHNEPAACLLAPYAATVSGVPAAPGSAGPYTLIPSVTSSIHTSCDVVPTNATLTIDKAPTQILVDPLYFTLFSDTTSFEGKVNVRTRPRSSRRAHRPSWCSRTAGH